MFKSTKYLTLLLTLCLSNLLSAAIHTELIFSSSQSQSFDSQFNSVKNILGTVFNQSSKLSYVTFNGNSSQNETISSTSSSLAEPFLLYDLQGNPIVYVASKNKEIFQFSKLNNQWSQKTVFSLDQNLYPNLYVKISDIKIDKNGAIHIICVTDYTVFYITNSSGTWNTNPEIVETLSENHVNVEFGFRISIRGLPSLAIDNSGKAHIAYSTTYESRYLTNQSGSWKSEDIFRDTNMDYWPAENPVLRLDMNQTPTIVATEMDHAITGSLTNSNLRYLSRNGKQGWNSTIIAESADSYVGSDGNKYTGVNTTLLFDEQNRPHILFSDIASSHNQQGWNYTKNGQIRLAYLDNQKWQVSILYQQSPDNSEMLSLSLEKIDASNSIHYIALEVLRVGNVYDLYDSETYNLKYFYPDSSFTASFQSPTLQITANKSQSEISLSNNNGFAFSVQLNAGDSSGTPADWWLARLSPDNQLSYYDLAGTWRAEEKATYQGALIDLASFSISDSDFSLGPGKYVYYFAIDTNMNNKVDMDDSGFIYDQLEIDVSQ